MDAQRIQFRVAHLCVLMASCALLAGFVAEPKPSPTSVLLVVSTALAWSVAGVVWAAAHSLQQARGDDHGRGHADARRHALADRLDHDRQGDTPAAHCPFRSNQPTAQGPTTGGPRAKTN